MARSNTTSEYSVLTSLRTGLIVIVITLLIWIAADQSVLIDENITITIRPTSIRSDVYVAFAEPPFQRDIDIRVRGRRRSLEELQLWVANHGVIEIPIEAPESPIPFDMSVRESLLRRVGEIRRAGVVLSATPEQVTMRVDGYVEVTEVPVRVDYGELRVRDESGNKAVAASVPRFVEKDERFQSNRRAIVYAAPLIADRTPGGRFELNAKPSLELPMPLPENAIKLVPDTITLQGRIDSLEATESKGPITIKWSIPDLVLQDYLPVAENPDFFPYIEVKGPADRVARLDSADIRALVEVLARDPDSPGPNTTIQREVRIILPAGFGDCTITSPTLQMRFHLERRAATAGARGDVNGDAG
jgi:hypothetical protein